MQKMIVRDLGDLQDIELHILSDLHLGDKTCDIKAFRKWRDMILSEPNRFVVCNGDTINAALKDSKSDIYSETMTPQEQIDMLVEELIPIKDRILLYNTGNHNSRVNKVAGVDVDKFVCSQLGILDVYGNNFLKVKFGKRINNHKQQTYNIYANHETSSSLPTIERFCGSFENIDCFVFSHTHRPLSRIISKIRLDSHNNTIKQQDSYILVSGSFLNWIGSYGQVKNYQPQSNVMGYFRLSGRERKIEVVL